jgi:hypothetical protein
MTENKINITVSAVAWQEGDQWIAQGIEYDIVAHAGDVSSLPKAFMQAVVENVVISVHLGREPLQGIKQAPEKFRELYEHAETSLDFVRAPDFVPEPAAPAVRIRVVPPQAAAA